MLQVALLTPQVCECGARAAEIELVELETFARWRDGGMQRRRAGERNTLGVLRKIPPGSRKDTRVSTQRLNAWWNLGSIGVTILVLGA